MQAKDSKVNKRIRLKRLEIAKAAKTARDEKISIAAAKVKKTKRGCRCRGRR